MRKLFSRAFPPIGRQNQHPYLGGVMWLVAMLACAACSLAYHNGDFAYVFLVVAIFVSLIYFGVSSA